MTSKKRAPPLVLLLGAGLVLQPDQQAVQVLSVHIEQEAEQGAGYRFRISELFRPEK